MGWSEKKKWPSSSISYAEIKFQSDDIKIFVTHFFGYSVFPYSFQCWKSLLLAFIGLDMVLYVRYASVGHLLMIRNDCLDLKTPKEALTTFVHNMLNKQFFRLTFWNYSVLELQFFFSLSHSNLYCKMRFENGFKRRIRWRNNGVGATVDSEMKMH